MLGRQAYSLGELGAMTVEGRPTGYLFALLPAALSVALILYGYAIIGLVLLVPSAAASLVLLQRARTVLEVRANGLRYRRRLFNVRSTTAPLSALAAIRVADAVGHEIRTAAVDFVLVDPSLPPAFRVFESLDRDTAMAVGQQVSQHLNVPLLDDLHR